jgi:hypothetical protein
MRYGCNEQQETLCGQRYKECSNSSSQGPKVQCNLYSTEQPRPGSYIGSATVSLRYSTLALLSLQQILERTQVHLARFLPEGELCIPTPSA